MDDIVKRICYLPVDFHRLQTVSAIQLLMESGYIDNSENITTDVIEAFLREHEELIQTWLAWSADSLGSARPVLATSNYQEDHGRCRSS